MAKMKVVQCWDDGVINDIRLTELLRKYNAKATFNLNPGLMEHRRLATGWQRLNDGGGHCFRGFYAGKLSLEDIPEIYDGFEVASHCWKHENADTMPPEEWIKTAVSARNFLEDIVQRPCTGFAWPCGIFTPETCSEMRKAGFSYGRTTVNVDYVTECEDAMALHTNCHFMDTGFYDRYEKAKKCGVFYFWGHSYEMMDYDKLWEQFELKLKYISEDADAEWANVADIAPLCDGRTK